MKAKITIIAVLALAMGCTKMAHPGGDAMVVTFQVGGIRTGEIGTKAGSPNAILSATAPSGELSLKVVSTTNQARKYTAQAGVPIALPADTYQVTGEYIPTAAAQVWHGTAYREPRFSVSSTIEVTDNETNFTLPAHYDCFALVIDFQECEKYRHTNGNITQEDITQWEVLDGYGVLYVTCNSSWTASIPYTIQAYPAHTAEGEMQAYQLITSGTGGKIVENGKWYCFSPGRVDKFTGTISTSFPAWEDGNN